MLHDDDKPLRVVTGPPPATETLNGSEEDEEE